MRSRRSRARRGGGKGPLPAALLAALCLSAAFLAGNGAAPLRVGTSGDYPPFSSVGEGEARHGFDIDLAGELAGALGRPPAFVEFQWLDLAERARGGAFDLVASGVTIRPERALFGRFTRPVAVAEALVLVAPGDEARFRSLADVDVEGVHVVVNQGGHLEKVARATFRRAEVIALADNLRLGETILRRRGTAIVSDSIERWKLPPLAVVASLSRDRKALLVPDRPNDAAGARDLFERVDGWLAEHNSEVDALRRRWLGLGESIDAEIAQAQAIVALVDQRLGLMPLVADAKRAAGLPIEDEAREENVLAAAAERAAAANLPVDQTVALFRVLIEASKDIQRAAPAAPPLADLDSLRRVLGDLDDRLVAEIRRGRDLGERGRQAITFEIRGLAWPGLDDGRKDEIARRLRLDAAEERG